LIKRLLIICIFFLLVVSSIGSLSVGYKLSEKINSIDNINSFHKEISGSKFWLAIKADFPEATNITIEYSYNYSSNNSKTNFFFDLFHGKNGGYFYGLKSWGYGYPNIDRYLQIHLGPLNWSYYHNDSDIEWWAEGGYLKWGFRNITGTYYLTYGAFTTEFTLNLWINASKNSTFSTTQGTEVFKFERNDFFGTFNIGWRRGTFILNGKKEIQINNSLFAWFDTSNFKNGFEILKYQSPTGDYKRLFQIDTRGEHINYNFNETMDFKKGLWWGPSGKWTFKATMFNFGLNTLCPNIHLFGADIKLPE
jgi:hypothetical protein